MSRYVGKSIEEVCWGEITTGRKSLLIQKLMDEIFYKQGTYSASITFPSETNQKSYLCKVGQFDSTHFTSKIINRNIIAVRFTFFVFRKPIFIEIISLIFEVGQRIV
jgi:hypothetical protein